MELWKPSWTYLASSPSPSCSLWELVLNESSVYPISDGCNISGGSSNGTSVNSGSYCFLTTLSFLPTVRR